MGVEVEVGRVVEEETGGQTAMGPEKARLQVAEQCAGEVPHQSYSEQHSLTTQRRLLCKGPQRWAKAVLVRTSATKKRSEKAMKMMRRNIL